MIIILFFRFFSLGEATSLGEGKLWIQTCWTPLKKLTLCHILPERRGWVNMIILFCAKVIRLCGWELLNLNIYYFAKLKKLKVITIVRDKISYAIISVWILNLIYTYIYIYIYVFVDLATIVEGDPKVPFSIATTQRCRGGRYSFPWIAPLYPWSLPYNAEC